jgi:hypothetical protein
MTTPEKTITPSIGAVPPRKSLLARFRALGVVLVVLIILVTVVNTRYPIS